MQPKILHISASYKPAYVYGGPVISVATLCEALSSNNILVEVFTTTANGKTDFDYVDGQQSEIEGVKVRYFKRITGDHSHLSPSLYKFIFKRISAYPIIHIHAWWNLVSIGTALICWFKRKKFIISPRGTLSNYSFYNRTSSSKRLFHNLIGKLLLRNAVFQVSSTKEANDIKNLFPAAITYVIPNFVDLTGTTATGCFQNDSPVLSLLFFSRIEEKKGLEFLLSALPLLKFPYVLNIYGEGEQSYIDDLKALISQGIQNNVNFKGAVYGNIKYEILAKHDVLILPSYDENFANVVIESLAVGTPLLLSSNVGLSDYVVNNKLGWLCKQDPQDISAQLSMIYELKSERNRIRIEAPPIIAKDYSKHNLLRQYLKFYSAYPSL